MATWIGSASVTWASVSVVSFWLAVWDDKIAPDASIIYATLALAGVCVALATAIAEVLPTNDEWRRERMQERLKSNRKGSSDLRSLANLIGLVDSGNRPRLTKRPRIVAAAWIVAAIAVGIGVEVLTGTSNPQGGSVAAIGIPLATAFVYLVAPVGGTPRPAPILAIVLQFIYVGELVQLATNRGEPAFWAAVTLVVIWSAAIILATLPQWVAEPARRFLLVSAGIARQRKVLAREHANLQPAVRAADFLAAPELQQADLLAS